MASVTLKGGDKLKAALSKIAKELDTRMALRVGFLEGATYPDGTPVAMVAAIQEFGAPAANIPSRSFFRPMIAEKSPEWGEQLAAILKLNDYDVAKSLSLMGEGIKGQLQQSIIDINTPELSQITLMLRKMKSEDQGLIVTGATVGEAAARVARGESTAGVNTKPLDETGHMINSVDYEVTT